jgi:uncharacterized repeat protein (TIGR01451 family)
MKDFLPIVVGRCGRGSARRNLAFALALLLAPQAMAWPDLRIGKSGPAQAAPGEVITYTLSYTNSGPVKSTSVEMKDFVPPNVSVLTGTLNGGTLSGSTISWSIGTLNSKAKGSRTFQVRINTNAPSGSFITNRVQIFGKEAEEPGDSNDNSANWITAIVGVNRAPVAQDDAYSVAEDTTLTIAAPGILANDSDADGNALTALLVGNPTNGILALNANGSFSYTPNTNYHGVDSFTYRARDGTTNSGLATVRITVNPINDPPVARADQYSTTEDVVLNVPATGVLTNDSDADGNVLTAIIATQPGNGIVSLNANGSFSYTPNSNYHGADSFTYRAHDGTTNSGIATVTIMVVPVNDAPVARNDAYTVNENSTLGLAAPGVLANDSDPEGNALTVILVNFPTNGLLLLGFNGRFIYTPSSNYHGADSFTYRASDGTTNSGIATVTITVVPVNDPPVALNDQYSTVEDRVLIVPAPGVLGNDSDPDGDALTAIISSNPAHGTVTLNAEGSFIYSPNTNYTGVDSFTYRASDGVTNSGLATVSITVTGANDAPLARDDQYTVPEDTVLQVSLPGVLANDSDPDGDVLTANVASLPASGQLTLNLDGGFAYTPKTNFSGTDSFTYRASDGITNSELATVTITVTGANDSPVAQGDDYSMAEDTVLMVSAPGVLGNDSDPDSDALITILSSGPAHGTLALNADGGFTYTPSTNYSGVDSFTYRASDGLASSELATVTITVLAANDPPVAQGDNYSMPEDTILIIAAPGVLGNDSDPDGNALTSMLATAPAHGALTFNADGSFTYTPETNFFGVDSFTYRANDGMTNSDIATVTITVLGTNDPPVAQDDQYTTPEDTVVLVTAPGVLLNDSDPDGDLVTAVFATAPANGLLTLISNGGFSYTPNANFNGLDTFTYRANDGALDSGLATVTIRVTPVNNPPDTNNWTGSSFVGFEDAVLNVVSPGVLAGIVDVDGDLLTVIPVAATTNGALNLNPDGSFSYVPNTNFNGADSFQFRVSDGTTNSGVLTASITVLPVNDVPSFVKGSNFRIPQNAGLQSIPGWATAISPGPADESGQSVVFQVTNDQGALFVAPPTINPNGTLTYTPANNASGMAIVTVVAQDNGGTVNDGVNTSAPQTFTIFINAPPTVRIASPSDGASFFVPASFTLLAEAEDVDGSVVKVELFSGTNAVAELNSGEPYFTVLTNLPVGTYTFGAIATDDFGATGSATPVTVNVIARPPLTFLTSVYYNPQRDFFEQRVRVTNPTYSTLDAVRILVFNLTNVPPITVGNRTGFTNGVPYVQSSGAIPPGSYVDLTIEFLSPLRIMPNPILQAALVPPAGPPSQLQGTLQPINRGTLLANRTFLVEFATLSNRVYAIQYSGDLATWLTAHPAITGTGNWIQWIDNGEPKTVGSPADAAARFYRLFLLP